MLVMSGRRRTGQRGFTLIEIAIVVALIGLLLTISLPLFSGARNRAYLAEGRVLLAEWKAMMWTCLIEKNFNKDSCDTLAEIGWSSRPTSDVWDSGAGLTDSDIVYTPNSPAWATVAITMNGLSGGPIPGAAITLTLTRANGRVTETLSGI